MLNFCVCYYFSYSVSFVCVLMIFCGYEQFYLWEHWLPNKIYIQLKTRIDYNKINQIFLYNVGLYYKISIQCYHNLNNNKFFVNFKMDFVGFVSLLSWRNISFLPMVLQVSRINIFYFMYFCSIVSYAENITNYFYVLMYLFHAGDELSSMHHVSLQACSWV